MLCFILKSVKYFQNCCICVGFGRAVPGTGTCSNCLVLIILRLCRTPQCSCWCSCVCWGGVKPELFLQPQEFLAVAAARQGWDSHTGGGKKGGLVEYTGGNVNIFYYYGMSRTTKMLQFTIQLVFSCFILELVVIKLKRRDVTKLSTCKCVQDVAKVVLRAQQESGH